MTVHFLLNKQVVCTRLQRLQCMHNSMTNIATVPIETCTSVGVLRHTFYPSRRPNVILVIIFFAAYMKMVYYHNFLLTPVRQTKVSDNTCNNITRTTPLCYT